MKKATIVHVMRAEKFIPAFIDFVNSHFEMSSHQFRVMSKGTSLDMPPCRNVIVESKRGISQIYAYLSLAVAMHNADRIMLHGLLNFKVIRLLWLMPWVRKKCYWGIWGHDLYCHEIAHTSPRRRREERVRQKVIKDIGHIVTSIEGDFKNAVKWYGATGCWLQTYWYPASLFVPLPKAEPKQDVSTVRILIGNSAAVTNNHLEVLSKLKPYSDKNIELVVPLSYGSEKNAKAVVKYGQEHFGEKFKPLTEFMPLDKYNRLLASVDIAIFHHRRQQAMSNIRVLLGMGKRVYLHEGISSTDSLERMGIKTFRLKDFTLTPDFEEREENIRIIRNAYSEEALKKNLNTVFYGFQEKCS